MERRAFVAAACTGLCGAAAGCSKGDRSNPEPLLYEIELENHRRDAGYAFRVRIEDGDETHLDETYSLGPAGSGDAALALDRPVAEPGAYAVRVDVDERSATLETGELVSEDEGCLRLQFSLGDETLHAEHYSYDECE